MTSPNGRFFSKIDLFWSNLRKFSYRNRTIFEIIFILVYTLEQLALVWLTFKVKDSGELTLIISIFAIIVLTTFSLQKFIMESEIKLLKDEVKDVLNAKDNYDNKVKFILKKYNELISELNPKDLNKIRNTIIHKESEK